MAYPVAATSADNGLPFVNVVNTCQRVNWNAEILAGAGGWPIGLEPSPNTFVGTTNNTWLIIARAMLSFCIVIDAFSAALNVDLSVDGGTTWLEAYTFPLGGEGVVATLNRFPLCASAARFRIVTGAGNTTTSGWLEVRAV